MSPCWASRGRAVHSATKQPRGLAEHPPGDRGRVGVALRLGARFRPTAGAVRPGPTPGSVPRGQSVQDLHVLRVWAVALEAWDLEDERDLGQAWVVQQRPEAGLSDLALADVCVPVPVGTKRG